MKSRIRMHRSISYSSLFVVPSLSDLGVFCTEVKVTVRMKDDFHVMFGAVWVPTSQPPSVLPVSTNHTISNFPKLHPPPTISHRNTFAMPCPDLSGQHLLSLQGDASIAKYFKGKYEDDLKATIQELSELNQETRHVFDMEKEDKTIICTNKINELTAKIAQLDEQLASLDEQIQRWKEENPPSRQLSQREMDEQTARMPKNRAFLDRIR